MNMSKGFSMAVFLVLLLACVAARPVDKDLPKVKRIKIDDQVTRLVVDILPGRGVKCIFPWILDVNSFDTPFKATITNDQVFEMDRGEKQNFLAYKVSGRIKNVDIEGEVADAFVSVAGYHFNLALRVNFSKSAHYSTIIFELSDAKRVELIDEAIRRRRQALEKEFAEKEKQLDQRASKLALKTIARTVLTEPQKNSVYEKERFKTANGDRIVFQAGKILSYGNLHILTIGVENDSGINPLYVNGVQIEKATADNSPLLIEYEIAPRIDPGEMSEGFVVTEDPRLVNDEDTAMTLLTDKGEVELRW